MDDGAKKRGKGFSRLTVENGSGGREETLLCSFIGFTDNELYEAFLEGVNAGRELTGVRVNIPESRLQKRYRAWLLRVRAELRRLRVLEQNEREK